MINRVNFEDLFNKAVNCEKEGTLIYRDNYIHVFSCNVNMENKSITVVKNSNSIRLMLQGLNHYSFCRIVEEI